MVDVAGLGALVLQAAIFCALVVAVRRGNVSAAVNGTVSLLVAVLPVGLQYLAGAGDGGILTAWPELTLWVATAGFLHTVGMLGWYESVWWWDHLTHTVSAALVAALVYAGLLVVEAGGGTAPRFTVAVVTVGYVFVVGVFWEVVELVARAVGERFDVEPILIHYGWRDTALDLVFDLVGAVVVVAVDLRTFVSLADRAPGVTEDLVVGVGGVVVAAIVIAAVLDGTGLVRLRPE